MKKILITGINGFLGNSFAEYLTGRGYDVAGLSRRKLGVSRYSVYISSYSNKDLVSILLKFKPEIIIHAAGSASVHRSISEPYKDYLSSVSLFYSLLDSIRLSGSTALTIFLSSAAVYGNQKLLPINEESSSIPISPYGFNKLICEIAARQYSVFYDLPILVLRLFSVFGPTQKRLLIWELYKQFTDKIAKKVILKGTGHETRDYLYINILNKLLEMIINNYKKRFDIINVASGKSIKINQVAQMMKNILGNKKLIYYKNKKQIGSPANWQADVSKLEKLIKIKIHTDFKNELSDCLKEWKR